MREELYILSISICILILTCITIYFYLVKPTRISYHSIEGFVGKEGIVSNINSSCSSGICGSFLDEKCHYKNAETESGTIGPKTLSYDYDKNIKNPNKLGAGLKKKYGDFALCDFYIMTAFNCCASGRFDSDHATPCALENSMRYGARCLDFAIYSAATHLPNAMEPIISYSNRMVTTEDGAVIDNHFAKSSKNDPDFTLNKALSIVKQNAFSNNVSDPLILHFRIKTASEDTMNQMHDILVKYFGSTNRNNKRLLDTKYGYCGEGADFDVTSAPIKELRGKVIILVDNYGNKFKRTKLYKITNSSTGSFNDPDTYHSNFRNMTISDIKNIGTPDQLAGDGINQIEHFNKTRLMMVIPDKTSGTNNIHNGSDNNMMFGMERGAQFIGMSFQQFDSSLQYYLNEIFSNRSLVLKPSHLRYVPILMDVPVKQKREEVDPKSKTINISSGTDIVFPIVI